MTVLHWLVAAIWVGVVALLARSGIRTLGQARLLLGWRKPSLDGLDGRAAALRGEVRANGLIRVESVGDCLWQKEDVYIYHGDKLASYSSSQRRAAFSIEIDGRLFIVSGSPTEVAGRHRRQFWPSPVRMVIWDWLPAVDHLTVVGRVRKDGGRWFIEKDPRAGLVYSVHPPERTAMWKAVQGGLVLAFVPAALAGLWWVLSVFR